MKIRTIGEPFTVQDNPISLHNYFGWPTVTRIKDGRLAVASSGFRLGHICPFGKAVLSFSRDEGTSFTRPMPVIDTVLDDRDAGLCPFGQSGLILTSFNNTVAFQRKCNPESAYIQAYLDSVLPEQEKKALGSTFRVSLDNGVSFGPLFHAPVTSPHGPIELKDGRILWVGRRFSSDDSQQWDDGIEAWELFTDGSSRFVGKIENLQIDGRIPLSCEPNTIELPDGRLLTHIRVQSSQGSPIFTTYQSQSADGGRTWTKPHALLERRGGAPAHLLMAKSGVLLSVYGYREKPYGIRIMYSLDGGENWSVDHILYVNPWNADLGYPATVEIPEGFLTVFYAHPKEHGPAVILGQKWYME